MTTVIWKNRVKLKLLIQVIAHIASFFIRVMKLGLSIMIEDTIIIKIEITKKFFLRKVCIVNWSLRKVSCMKELIESIKSDNSTEQRGRIITKIILMKIRILYLNLIIGSGKKQANIAKTNSWNFKRNKITKPLKFGAA